MSGIFNSENPFFQGVSKVMSMIALDFLWLLLCVPIITAGASTTAFYYAIQKSVWHERGYVVQSFFESFKRNFRQSTKIWLIFLGLFLVLAGDIAALKSLAQAGIIAGGYHYFFYVVLVLAAAYAVWALAYTARFEDSLKTTMKNAVVLMIANMPKTILIILLIAGAALVVWLMPVTILIMPVAALWLSSSVMEKCFRKVMTDEVKAEEDALNMEYHSDYAHERKKGKETDRAPEEMSFASLESASFKDGSCAGSVKC